MVAQLIVEGVTLSRCSQADVHGEDSSPGNNEFSMQDTRSNFMVFLMGCINHEPNFI